MLSEGLFSLISKDPAVGAILAARTPQSGEPKTSGVFPNVLPEAEPLPAIVYQEIHGSGTMTQDGPDALQFSRMQFDCYAMKFIDAKKLARALRQLLEGFTGLLSDGTQLFDAERISENDVFEEVPGCHRTILEMKIAYDDAS